MIAPTAPALFVLLPVPGVPVVVVPVVLVVLGVGFVVGAFVAVTLAAGDGVGTSD